MFTEYLQQNDIPIIGCATALERSAIGVIRISGFKILNYLLPFFPELPQQHLKKRRVYTTWFENKGDKIDQVCVVYFPAPASYTGEEVVEISTHGNPVIINLIQRIITANTPIRSALPGEFSFRAHQNKKINLLQLEGINQLLHATTPLGLQQGLKLLSNEVYQEYQHLRELFVHLKMSLEIFSDFLEDVGEEAAKNNSDQRILDFDKALNDLLKRCERPSQYFLVPKILISGKVNVGKSTLFNFLLESNRAIVSPEPGTTRDWISEDLWTSHGVRFQIIDTAGDREADNQVEQEGILRAKSLSSQCFFKILVMTFEEYNRYDTHEFLTLGPFHLLVVTHLPHTSISQNPNFIHELAVPILFVELASKTEIYGLLGPIGPAFKDSSGPIGPVFKNSDGPIGPSTENSSGPIGPSAENSSGPIGPSAEDSSGPIGPFRHLNPDEIRQQIIALIENYYQLQLADSPILVQRHQEVIKKMGQSWQQFKKIHTSQFDLAIILSELQVFENDLSELLGLVSTDEVLNGIFDHFCIGK